MPDGATRILAHLALYPEGASDRELYDALGFAHYSQVNQLCNRLARQGAIERTKDVGRGIWVNRLPEDHVARDNRRAGASSSVPFFALRATTVVLHSMEDALAFAYPAALQLDEDWVKAAVRAALVADRWAVTVAWGHSRGIDLLATRDDERLVIEAKGEGSLNPMFNNYFLGALGELIQRMDGSDSNYALAFPAHRKFARLATELSLWVRHRLELWVYFAKPQRDGMALVGTLPPPKADE